MQRLSILPVLLALCASVFPVAAQQQNTLTPAELREGWKLLFDGKTLNGWMWSTAASPPVPCWAADGGTLHTTPGDGKKVYLLTRESFTDFEFAFEWKADPKANSGVKYRMQGYGGGAGPLQPEPHEAAGRIEPTGLEYQIADDDANPDAVSDPRHATAAIYEYWPANKLSLAGANVWHTGKILVRGRHIEHWLDDRKVVDVNLADPLVIVSFNKSRRKQSAALFVAHERRTSPIALQMHDATVWFRNLKVRPL